MSKTFRRIVTGHDSAGKAIIQSAAPPARVQVLGNGAGPTFFEVWNTRETPAMIDRASGEPFETQLTLSPPKHGTRIRVLDIPAETGAIDQVDPAQAHALFAEIGAAAASTHADSGTRHPHMHRTETIDYGIVLEGEITLLVDEGEVVVQAGDIVIQRGTNHAWANRSGRPCRIAFILIDGQFTDGLACTHPPSMRRKENL
jgi:mannose-6-phosphate isomerase-like protein (cupin superfamily)